MNLTSAIFFNHKPNNEQGQLNIWWQGAALLLILALLNIPLYLFDERLLADEALWAKPLKFEMATMLHLITLAVLAAFISAKQRNSDLWKGASYVVVASALFEVMYIFLQAARGRESHYNDTTLIESAMYGLMGLGAVLMVLGSLYLGYLLYQAYKAESNRIFLLSAALGLIIGSVLTLFIAGALSSPENSHAGDVSQMVIRAPLFGWYLDGLDLRIPHFLATHMMQLIPLYGWWLSRRNLSQSGGKRRLYWVTGVYTVLTLGLWVLALV